MLNFLENVLFLNSYSWSSAFESCRYNVVIYMKSFLLFLTIWWIIASVDFKFEYNIQCARFCRFKDDNGVITNIEWKRDIFSSISSLCLLILAYLVLGFRRMEKNHFHFRMDLHLGAVILATPSSPPSSRSFG